MDNTPKKTNFLYYAPAIGWGILIAYFSLVPSKKLPNLLLDIKDVFLHFGIYAVLGLLFVAGNMQFKRQFVHTHFLFAVFIGAFLFGFAIEMIQGGYIEGRHFEWADLFFNTLGTLIIFPFTYFYANKA